ncbi:MAG TPA: MauE/DoxX family redox-associated membrane protein [Aldersonia sp.]
MWVKWVGLLARLGLAAIWLISGALKAADPVQTTVAVGAYQLLPHSLVRPVADTLPFVEIAIGLVLLAGIGVRAAAVASTLVLAVLIGAVASAWARGLSIDCGCFGGGGPVPDASWRDYAGEILRDVGFLALALWLIRFPRTPFALGPGSRAPRSADSQADLAESAPDSPSIDRGRL